jgi:sec-independent protein translocase protein TatB
MTFLGMGNLEVVIVLLVAFIFLGPERMVDAARLMGKAVREVRRMASELPSLDLDESMLEPDETPAAQRNRDQRPADQDRSSSKSSPDGDDDKAPEETSAPSGTPETDEDSARTDAPVAFRPAARESASPAQPAADESPQDRT